MKLTKSYKDDSAFIGKYSSHNYLENRFIDFEEAAQTEKIGYMALNLGLAAEYMTLEYAMYKAKWLANSQTVMQKKRIEELRKKNVLSDKQKDFFLSIAYLRNRLGGHVHVEENLSGDEEGAEEKEATLSDLIEKYTELLNKELGNFFKVCPTYKTLPAGYDNMGDWIFEEDLTPDSIFSLGKEFELDFQQTLIKQEQKAKKGNGSSGDNARSGMGFRMAQKCYEKAAEKEYLPAYSEMIEFWTDTSRGNKKSNAIKYLDKLEKSSDPDALLYVAYLYCGNSLKEQDIPKARAYFEQAGEAGNHFAFLELAQMFQLGRGTTRDPERACFYYEKAIELGEKQERDCSYWKKKLEELKKTC